MARRSSRLSSSSHLAHVNASLTVTTDRPKLSLLHISRNASGKSLPSNHHTNRIFSKKKQTNPSIALTDNIPLHQMKSIQMRYSLFRIVRTLKYDISRSFRLEILVGTQSDLTDGTVFTKEVVEIGAGNVEVAKGERWIG